MGQLRLLVAVGVFASVVLSIQAAPTDSYGPPRSLEDDLDVNQLEDDQVTVNPFIEDESPVVNEDKDFHEGHGVTTDERYYRVYSDGTIEFKTALSNGHVQYQRITHKVVGKRVIQVYRGYVSQRYADGRYGTTYYVADERGYRQTRVDISAQPPVLPYEGQIEPVSPRINENDHEEEDAAGRSNDNEAGNKFDATTEQLLETSSSNWGLNSGISTELPGVNVNTDSSTDLKLDWSTELPSESSSKLPEIVAGISTELPVTGVYTHGNTELPVLGVNTEVNTELPLIVVDSGVRTDLPTHEISTEPQAVELNTDAKSSTELPISRVISEESTGLPNADIGNGVSTELPTVVISTSGLPISDTDSQLSTELPISEKHPVILDQSSAHTSTESPILPEVKSESSSSVVPESTTVFPAIDINKDHDAATDLPDLEAEITTDEIDFTTIQPSSVSENLGSSTESSLSSINLDDNIQETSSVIPINDDISPSVTELSSGDDEIEAPTPIPVSVLSPALAVIDASNQSISNDNSTKPIEVPAALESVSYGTSSHTTLPSTSGQTPEFPSTEGTADKTVDGKAPAYVHQP